MKFSLQALQAWLKEAVASEKLLADLTMLGFEVEATSPMAPAFNKVVVGEILSARPHPNASRLQVCEVNIGGEQPLSIVCGAKNAREALRVAVAQVGAELPLGVTIQLAELRGVISSGMLCSAVELGLSDQSDGIMELPENAPIGHDFRHYYQLDDVSVTLNITPNRGDALSLLGLARDLSAYYGWPFMVPKAETWVASFSSPQQVNVIANEACPKYLAVAIKDLDPKVTSPVWLSRYLAAAQIRSHNLIVDILNYVMLETGQPLHAFDAETLNGEVTVRYAKAGEQLILLNEMTLTFGEEKYPPLVIADANGPVALAGIMGGKGSEVKETSAHILIEGAFFSPKALAGVARQYGLVTDAAQRFERGVDPAITERALAQAVALIQDYAGGHASQRIEVITSEMLPSVQTIPFDFEAIETKLGIELAAEEAIGYLNALGCKAADQTAGLVLIETPSHRFDLTTEIDLLEEIARLYGYDKVKAMIPSITLAHSSDFAHQAWRKLESLLIARGYLEAINYSFIGETWFKAFSGQDAYTLLNPISQDLAHMRPSLLPGLLKSLEYNVHRQEGHIKLFERGRSLIQGGGEWVEQEKIAGLGFGALDPLHWQGEQALNFYALKGDLEALFNLAKLPIPEFKSSDLPLFLHPGQSARLVLEGQEIGICGALHPALVTQFDLTGSVWMFELDLATLLKARVPQAVLPSKYPQVRRDLALIIPKTLAADDLLAVAEAHAGELVRDIKIFDVYEGASLSHGMKSIALALFFESYDRTLVDTEIDSVLNSVIFQLEKQCRAKLRSSD